MVLSGSLGFFQTFAPGYAEVTLTQPVAVDEVDAEIVVVEGRIIAAWNVPLFCRIFFDKVEAFKISKSLNPESYSTGFVLPRHGKE